MYSICIIFLFSAGLIIGMSFSFKIWGRLIFGRSYFRVVYYRKFIVNLGTVRRMFVIVGIHSTYGKERERLLTNLFYYFFEI